MGYLESPLFWLLAIVGVILTGISKSGFAGGAGVVAVPLLSLVMPVEQAAALMLPLLLIMDSKTVYLYRKSINLNAIKPIMMASVAGIAIAGSAMAYLTSDMLLLTLALFSILFACWHQLIPLLGKLPKASYLWGGLSGVSSTLLHAGGPPITIYFLSKGLAKKVWLAQAAIFFALMNWVKVIPYSLNHLWHVDQIYIVLTLLPVAMLGIAMGHKIQGLISDEHFAQSCRFLLGLTGVFLLIKTF